MKTHKNNQTKQLLLEAARELVIDSGFRSLTVRAVTSKAKINTGSFVYHFSSKENFVKEVLEAWYYPLFSDIELCNNMTQNPIEILRSMFVQIIVFLRVNQDLLGQLLLDVVANEKSVINFVGTVYARHPQLMLDVIIQGQKEKLICQKDRLHILVYLTASILGPFFVQNVIRQNTNLMNGLADIFEKHSLTDFETRIDWALKAIRYEEDAQ